MERNNSYGRISRKDSALDSRYDSQGLKNGRSVRGYSDPPSVAKDTFEPRRTVNGRPLTSDRAHYLNEDVDTLSEAFHHHEIRVPTSAATSTRHGIPGHSKYVDVRDDFLSKKGFAVGTPAYHSGSEDSLTRGGDGLPRQRSLGLLKTLTGDQKSEGLEKLKEKIRQQRAAKEGGCGDAVGGSSVSGSSGGSGGNAAETLSADVLHFGATSFIGLSNDEEFHRNYAPQMPSSNSLRRVGAGVGGHAGGHVTFAGQGATHYNDATTKPESSGNLEVGAIRSRKTTSVAHHGPSYRGFSVPAAPPPLPPKASKSDKKAPFSAVNHVPPVSSFAHPTTNVHYRDDRAKKSQKRHVGKSQMTDVITPFSWRKGQEATLAELGPSAVRSKKSLSDEALSTEEPRKVAPGNQFSPPTRDSDPEIVNKVPDISPITPIEDNEDVKENSVELESPPKERPPPGGGEATPISLRHVSIEAQKVLRDLQLPAKIEGVAKTTKARSDDAEPTTPSRTAARRARVQVGAPPRKIFAAASSGPNPLSESPKPKSSTQNHKQEELREWMAKKKADKRRQDKEKEKAEKEKEERKRMKLQELETKRKVEWKPNTGPPTSPFRVRPPSPARGHRAQPLSRSRPVEVGLRENRPTSPTGVTNARHFGRPRSYEKDDYIMDEVLKLPRGGESVIIAGGGSMKNAQSSQLLQNTQEQQQRQLHRTQGVSKREDLPKHSAKSNEDLFDKNVGLDFDLPDSKRNLSEIPPNSSRLTRHQKIPQPARSTAPSMEIATQKFDAEPSTAPATYTAPEQPQKASISSAATSQARRKDERKRQLAVTAQSIQKRLDNFSTSFVGGAAVGSLTQSNNSINETQPKASATKACGGVVHLSNLRGPLPEASIVQEEESASSESTLTEANNGCQAANPAQLHDVLRPDPYPGFGPDSKRLPPTALTSTAPVSSAPLVNASDVGPQATRGFDPLWARVADPNPHSILAVYTNKMAEALTTDAVVKKVEDDLIDSQVVAVAAKYVKGGVGRATVETVSSMMPPPVSAASARGELSLCGSQKPAQIARPSSTSSSTSARSSSSFPRPDSAPRSSDLILSSASETAPKSSRTMNGADVSLSTSVSTTADINEDPSLGVDPLSSASEELDFSPSNLERQMMNQLNYLETADEGIRQLNALERTRAVALAQQETVSLAQVLKAQRLQQQRQVEALQAKSTKEKELAEAALAEAKFNLLRLQREHDGESARRSRESDTTVLNAQTEAAKVTASAAREIAAVAQSQRSMEERFTAMLAAARDASLAVPSAPTAVNAGTAGTQAAVSAVRELMRDQERRRQSAMAVGDADVFKAPQPATSVSVPSRSHHRSSKPAALASSTGDKQGSRPNLMTKSKSASDVGTTARARIDAPESGKLDNRPVLVASREEPLKPNASFSVPEGGHGPNRRDSLESSIASMAETTMGDLSIGSEVTFDMSYRTDFDDPSMTEQEKEDRSFRALLPSESHRRRHRSASSASALSRRSSREGSPASTVGDASSAALPSNHASDAETRRASIGGVGVHRESRYSLGGNAGHLPAGMEDSFSKFTHEIVHKYMCDERVRMEHEAAIIRLRENALKEKMQAQLEWIELQKVNAQKKGKKGEVDELMPKLKKKQMALLKRKEHAEAELRQQKEKLEVEHLQRQRFLMMHQQEISRMRSSTQMLKKRMEKMKGSSSRRRSSLESLVNVGVAEQGRPLGVAPPSSLPASAEQTMVKSPASSGQKPKKTEDSHSLATSIKKAFESSRDKIGGDVDGEKELEARQVRLEKRKRDVEKLKRRLTWSQRLDEEEALIRKEEKELVAQLKEKGAELDVGIESSQEPKVKGVAKPSISPSKPSAAIKPTSSPASPVSAPASPKLRPPRTPSPSSPSFASSARKTVEKKSVVKRSGPSDDSVSEEVPEVVPSSSVSPSSHATSAAPKKRLTFDDEDSDAKPSSIEVQEELPTSLEKSVATEEPSFSHSIFSPLKGDKTLESSKPSADKYSESFEISAVQEDSKDVSARISEASAPPSAVLSVAESVAPSMELSAAPSAARSVTPPIAQSVAPSVGPNEIISADEDDAKSENKSVAVERPPSRSRSTAYEASDVESDVESRIVVLQQQLMEKRRQVALLSAEKKKKKHDRLRRQEAKLREQISQMEEQYKSLQQERESSTSADEGISPFHTPKPILVSTPSIGHVSPSDKAAVAAADLEKHQQPQIRSPKASVSSPVPPHHEEEHKPQKEDGSTKASKAEELVEATEDVFEPTSDATLSKSEMPREDSSSAPLFDLKGTAEEEASVAVDVEASMEKDEVEEKKLESLSKADASSKGDDSIASQKERILSRVSDSINIKAFSGDRSPRGRAESPILSRKSSVSDTYKLDHSVLSESEVEEDAEASAEEDNSSPRFLVLSGAGEEKGKGEEIKSVSHRGTPFSKVGGFGDFRDVPDVIDSPMMGKDATPQGDAGKPSPGSYLEESNSSLGSLCADLAGKLKLASADGLGEEEEVEFDDVKENVETPSRRPPSADVGDISVSKSEKPSVLASLEVNQISTRSRPSDSKKTFSKQRAESSTAAKQQPLVESGDAGVDDLYGDEAFDGSGSLSNPKEFEERKNRENERRRRTSATSETEEDVSELTTQADRFSNESGDENKENENETVKNRIKSRRSETPLIDALVNDANRMPSPEAEPSKKKKPSKTQLDAVCAAMFETLVSGVVDQMSEIHRRKRERILKMSTPEQKLDTPIVEVSPIESTLAATTTEAVSPTKEPSDENDESSLDSDATPEDSRRIRSVITRPATTPTKGADPFLSDVAAPPSPDSPIKSTSSFPPLSGKSPELLSPETDTAGDEDDDGFQSSKDLDSHLLEMISNTGDQDWFDDDYAFPLIPQRPPPPYPGSSHIQKIVPEGPPSTPERLMSQLLNQRQEESKKNFSVVPNDKERVSLIVDEAVDILYDQHRSGKELQAPLDFNPLFASGRISNSTHYPKSSDEEAQASNDAFANLLFTMAKEEILNVYRDEYESPPLPWQESKKLAQAVARQKKPKSKEQLCNVVRASVSKVVIPASPRGMRAPQRNPKSQLWVNYRKSEDVVNSLIAEELRSEESSWTNVEEEEVDVKMSLADELLEDLLIDVAHWLAGFNQSAAEKIVKRK